MKEMTVEELKVELEKIQEKITNLENSNKNKGIRYFYKETGIYDDWNQINSLPKVNTLVDIGVAPQGTVPLWKAFKNSKLILVDPLVEARAGVNKILKNERTYDFECVAIGEIPGKKKMNIEVAHGRSSFLKTTNINKGEILEEREVTVIRLDELIRKYKLKNDFGIKVDTEGYELEVIKSGGDEIKKASFILCEVRHNHQSFEGMYQLKEFMCEIKNKGFVLTKILSAKPFIADLCFEPEAK